MTSPATEPRVPFNDIKASIAPQRDEIMAAIEETVTRADFINGNAVARFEHEFADFLNRQFVIGTSSGTAALHLMLMAAGIGPGDEIIVPAMTFIATAEAVTMCGAKPVFADSDPGTFNISVQTVQSRLSSRTRAILFVHLHGNAAGATALRDFAASQGLLFFEDCAQAHGARYIDGTAAGTLGIASAFSFFPAKNLGAFGDAGAVATNDPQLAERVRRLANHGRLEKYRHLEPGFNYRLDTLQAAVLRIRLRHLEQEVLQRQKLAKRYIEYFSKLPIRLQQQEPGARHAYHLFTILTDQRDALQKALDVAGIDTGIHYPIPLHRQPAYEERTNDSLPASEMIAEQTLSLPFYPFMKDGHVARVVSAMEHFFR